MPHPKRPFSQRPHSKPAKKHHATSWEGVSDWYGGIVGEEGSYYHRQVILPRLIPMLQLDKPETNLLDLACGEGILGRSLPQKIAYTGIDIAPSFIKRAKQLDPNKEHCYLLGDVTKPFPVEANQFSHAVIILALQNLSDPDSFFSHVAKALKHGGSLCMVLNHPCFRIPRQSSWGVDSAKKIQYRRIDRYMSPLDIPIQAHPGNKELSIETISFHHPISDYARWLFNHGFVIELIEEWCSDKISEGGAAKMENRSRNEIPLFMTIRARLI